MSNFWKAYPATWAQAQALRDQAARWHRQGLLSAGQHAAIEAAYPIEYYRPAWPVRVGLFVFTWLGMGLAGAFLALLYSNSSRNELTTTVAIGILMAIGCQVALWWFIREQKSYYSGLDNALLYGGMVSAIGTLWYWYDAHDQYQAGYDSADSQLALTLLAGLILAILLGAVVRYADPLLTAGAYVVAGFLTLAQLRFLPSISPRVGIWVLVVVVMSFGAAALALHRYLRARVDADYYAPALLVLKVLALATIYLGGNYFVVREAGSSARAVTEQVLLAWVLCVFTAVVPLLYLYLGLRRADRTLLLLGLFTLAFSLFTLRYYHSVLPPEWAATLGGLVLIGGAGLGLRYLRPQRHGLTSAPDDEPRFLNLEALIVAETATVPAAPGASGFAFGGGESGGGGATGSF